MKKETEELFKCILLIIIGYMTAQYFNRSISGFKIGGQSTCANFDCSDQTKNLASNADSINCNSEICTIDECCTVTPKYNCSGTKCIESSDGKYLTENCDKKCEKTINWMKVLFWIIVSLAIIFFIVGFKYPYMYIITIILLSISIWLGIEAFSDNEDEEKEDEEDEEE